MVRFRDEYGRFVSNQAVADAAKMRSMGDSSAPVYQPVQRRAARGQGEFDFGVAVPVGGGHHDRASDSPKAGREDELNNIDYGPGLLDLSDLEGEEVEIEDPTGD